MNIPPTYTITPSIQEQLEKIDTARTLLQQYSFPPLLKQNIERKILLKSSLFSARIEGNSLTEYELITSPKEREKLEVFNIMQAAKWAQTASPYYITLDHIQELHTRVLKKLSSNAGNFRTEMGAIFNPAGIAVYVSPPPKQVKPLLQKLFMYANTTHTHSPLITALISHLVFEKIHPFVDGNGRVGRLLIPLILKKHNYDFSVTVPIEEYLELHKEEYYYQLDQGMIKTQDYLEFMLDAFYEGTHILQQKIREADTGLPLLPPRQEELYQLIKDHRMLSLDMIQRRFLHVPPRTLRYDLKKLQDSQLIIKIGKTRGSYYTIPLAF